MLFVFPAVWWTASWRAPHPGSFPVSSMTSSTSSWMLSGFTKRSVLRYKHINSLLRLAPASWISNRECLIKFRPQGKYFICLLTMKSWCLRIMEKTKCTTYTITPLKELHLLKCLFLIWSPTLAFVPFGSFSYLINKAVLHWCLPTWEGCKVFV